MPIADSRERRILAIASGGGHWEQLMLLRDAFSGQAASYATTLAGLGERSGLPGVFLVPDCNRNRPVQAIWCLVCVTALIARLRPDVIVTTGALPGVIALAVGRRFGARTIWVDSVANAEELSMAGVKARKHADLWLSQWPGVAAATGAEYAGSVL